MISFPSMPDDFEPTRATLHAYALAVDSIPRVHAVPHPKWWHISLGVGATGLTTDPIGSPEGGTFQIRLDPRRHAILFETSSGRARSFSMQEGLTGTEMADRLIAAVADLGLEGEYDRAKFESDDPRAYDPEVALRYFEILSNVDQAFRVRCAGIEGEMSPIQLWPHNFDLSVEWFGTRRVAAGDEGGGDLPAQLNLGFYVEGRPYFYSNPWPFDRERLADRPLPSGATWHLEGWEGSILYYDQVAGREDALDRLLDYAAAVFDLAIPTLMA